MTKDEIKEAVRVLMPAYRAARKRLRETNGKDEADFCKIVLQLNAYGKALDAMGYPGTKSIAAMMDKDPRPA